MLVCMAQGLLDAAPQDKLEPPPIVSGSSTPSSNGASEHLNGNGNGAGMTGAHANGASANGTNGAHSNGSAVQVCRLCLLSSVKITVCRKGLCSQATLTGQQRYKQRHGVSVSLLCSSE